VTLSYGQGNFPVGHAIVDTGSDMTLPPIALAHLLEVELDEHCAIQVDGAGGGSFIAYPSRHKIGFAVEQSGYRPLCWQGTAFFATEQLVMLLGHFQCLENFDLLFHGKSRSLKITK
jgi:hypothetical protein